MINLVIPRHREFRRAPAARASSGREGSYAACIVVCFVWVVILSAALSAQSPTVSRVTPAAAAAGDLVILEGSDLDLASAVRFRAYVGGFVGFWEKDVEPLEQSADRIVAIVPTMAGFAGAQTTSPGDPLGSVLAMDGVSPSEALAFYYMQGDDTLDTLGIGTSLSTGQGRPVVSFALSGGPPAAGNDDFVLRLENALAERSAVLLLGIPGAGPYLGFGDGVFVLDASQALLVVPLSGIDGDGDLGISAPVPGPGPFGFSVAVQFAQFDPGSSSWAVSNGLQIDL